MTHHRNIKILTLFNFFTDFKLYAPIAVIYFTTVTGSFALAMGVFSLVMISSAVFEIPTGIFSDRIGRKKTIMLGAAAAVLFSIFYAIGQSFWILAIGAIFEGLSRAFYSGNNDALLHDTLAESKSVHLYGEILGKTRSMFQWALGISALVGGIISIWSFPLIMWLSVLPQVICLYYSFKIIEPSFRTNESGNIYSHLSESIKNFIYNKKLRLLSLSSIFGYAFGETSFLFVPAFFNTLWPIWAIGLARTISNISGALSFHFSGRLIKKFGGIKIMIIDNVTNRFINIFSTLFPSIFSPLFMSMTSIFYGVTTVAKNTLMQREFRDEQRATMSSLDSLAGSIVFCILAVFVGVVADSLSPARAILILQFFQVMNLFIYLKLFRYTKAEK